MQFNEPIKFFFYAGLLLLASPVLLLWARFRKGKLRPTAPKILVIPVLTRVGDLVSATPVFREIKIKYSKSYLTVISAGKAIGVLENNPRIDELININKEPFRGLFGRGRLYLHLMKKGFDFAFTLPPSPFGSLLALSSLAPFRVKTVFPSRSMAERLTDWLNTELKPYKAGEFLPGHYLSLLQTVGINGADVVKEVFITAEGEKKVSEFLASNGISGGDFLVGIAPSAGSKRKEWPMERFAVVADALAEKFKARVVIIDGAAGREKAGKFQSMIKGSRTAFAAVDFNLRELSSLMKRLSLFISVDTGPIHIAEALGVPAVDILGTETPGEMAPRSVRCLVLQPRGVPPVFSVTGVVGALNRAREAVLSITVLDVLGAVDELVKRGAIKIKN
ncbi:MAG: Glycosyl transferase, family 9 [Parcubacteria group bacterium GW2011_GWA2_47_21]|nr:MAG: Glycosyl transferase, family 9 [Parcubacteria group bacterium GW2011_GWA2_47_21]